MDASFKSSSGPAATTAVIRETHGEVVFGSASSCRSASLPILKGVELAESVFNGLTWVKFDAKEVIDALSCSTSFLD